MPTIGLLQLRLSQPSTITLSSAGGDRSELTGSTGELTLQLQSPVSLKVTPPPKGEDQVLWDGLPQTALNGQAGSYRLPQRDPVRRSREAHHQDADPSQATASSNCAPPRCQGC